MDNFLGRIRSGAGKAAFEADKLRRVASVQSTINGLKKEVEKAYYQIGQVAYGLYGNGRITQPELKESCDRLAGLQTGITAHEQEIAAIRAEEFVEPQVSFSPQYGRICPNGHGAISAQDTFCQTCGAKAVYVPPPMPTLAGSIATCPNCGTPLTADARFCATCGQPTSKPSLTLVPDPAMGACPNCGVPFLPDAVFCAECGHRVEPDEVVESETVEPEESDMETEMSLAEEPLVSGWEEEVEETGETAVILEANEPAMDLLDEPLLETTAETPITAEEENSDETAKQKIGACPVCGSHLLSDAAFCAECGHQIESEEL